MPRRPTPQQLDLFDGPCNPELAATPQWQSLPDEAQLTLTKLMVRLILEHAEGVACQGKEAGHDA